ncbi:MAG: biopolymer transporter ExbD [Proteobacteria bacterium]|nr:biopolymer transporter ExbD [Pseudomonadota bacterium]
MPFGRLERNPGPQPMSEINVTPLVDVMLVLVVIFILTAPLLAHSIRLNLPRAEGAQPGAPARAVVVALDAAGKIYLDNAPLDEQQLPERLRLLAASAPDAELQLRADSAVPYGRVAQLIGAAQAVGLQRIAFVTEPPKAAKK